MKKFLFSVAVLAISVLSAAHAQKFGKLLKDTPGAVSYTFRTDFAKDVPGTLDKVKAMGITNIEFSNLFGKTAAELRALLDERGMRCTSLGVSFDDLNNKTETVVQNAKTLGAEFVRIGSVPHKGPMDLDLAKKTVEDFNRFGQKLQDNGLTFCYHNHGFEFAPYQDATYFDYIVQNTNPKTVFYEMDVVWMHLPGQDPAAILKKYPKRFKLIHLKDLKKGVPSSMAGSTPNENCVVLGTGQINYPEILKAAKKSAIKYYYIEDENLGSMQQVPQSLVYLKSL
ncbi:sugar phosphate isomerase/epimerase [Runella sp. MFBS21]|uniref:sugar phosphate isomerase/epimerase family protein n=1 Tax=Runella sp. MFBS21 TaxID=3034018 RepID=UPI0023F8F53A|nr:sugar phosphate isomerase/epimerase [Runella sp. MFBS21]MDF7816682.1 sugar phosphate isomerase/epimerase [Runella sp. MFBS21]